MKNISRKNTENKPAGEKIEESELLDINELITGGRAGIIAYTMNRDFPACGIGKGDLVFVDPTAKNEKALMLHKKNGKNYAQRGFGLRLAAKNGKLVESPTDSDCLGKITFILKAVQGGAK